MINIRDIAEELVIIEKPMRAFSENSDQMLTEGNGWEVIDEDQMIELEKKKTMIIPKRNKSILGFKNYNNYTIKSNSRLF